MSCLGAEKHAIKVYWPPSWIFSLPVWSHSLVVSLIEKLDHENIGMAVGISLISCLGAEIHAFEILEAAILNFSTSGSVAQYSRKSQWNAGPQKRRFSCWYFGYILLVALSESGDTRNRSF